MATPLCVTDVEWHRHEFSEEQWAGAHCREAREGFAGRWSQLVLKVGALTAGVGRSLHALLGLPCGWSIFGELECLAQDCVLEVLSAERESLYLYCINGLEFGVSDWPPFLDHSSCDAERGCEASKPEFES